jgi:transcriptional regulator with XRE-family HTH domain
MWSMNKDEHGRRLKAAMASKRLSREDVAIAADVKSRTVTNWTSGATMPSDRERSALRALLGDYDTPGDPVIVALGQSELVEWRQDTVKGFYRRHLAEQREERGATA